MNIKEGFIVCSDITKYQILNDSELKDYHFLTLSSLYHKLTFEIKDEAYVYLSLLKKIDIEILKAYLADIYMIDLNEKYDDFKLAFLQEILADLVKNDFIIKDDYFIQTLKRKNLTFVNMTIPSNIKYLLDKYDIFYEVIQNEEAEKVLEINEFHNLDDELYFVLKNIKSLIKSGIDINDIKIFNYTESNLFKLRYYLDLMGIPYYLPSDRNILSKDIVIEFMSLLELNDFPLIISKLKEKEYENIDINLIVGLINKYNLINYEPKKLKQVFRYLFTNTKYDSTRYDNQIEIKDISDIDKYPNCYNFLLNFDSNIIKLSRDDDYLSSDLKEIIHLPRNDEKNAIKKEDFIKSLKSMKNLCISFSFEHSFEKKKESFLASDSDFKIIKHDESSFMLNRRIDNIKLAKSLDNFIRLNKVDPIISNFYNKIGYKTYNHKYKRLSKSEISKYLPKEIELSYSAMSDFFYCPFAYFVKRVLKANTDKEVSLDIKLGNFAHKIFENEKKGFNKALEIANNEVLFDTYKENYFKNRMALFVKDLIEYDSKIQVKSTLNDTYEEKELAVTLLDGALIVKGKADKILSEDDGINKYVAIIDYKTGKNDPDLSFKEEGLNLQLPMYLFLLRNDDNNKSFRDFIPLGIYLKKINLKVKEDVRFRLYGYSNKDIELLKKIDKDLLDDNYVDGLTTTGKLKKYSLSEDDFKNLEELVKEKVIYAYNNIKDGNFDISPLFNEEKKLDACKFCDLKDICYRKKYDYREIEKESD